MLYEAVGKALSTWELVEGCFSGCFSMFMQSTTEAAERVYGTLVSNAMKREVLHEASTVAFYLRGVAQQHQDDWKALVAHYEPASARRTEIAHGQVTGLHSELGSHGHFLVPPMHNSKKTDPMWIAAKTKSGWDIMGDYRYTTKDITHFTDRFDELTHWARGFLSLYASRYPRLEHRPRS
jgi:hypothetical protein